MDLSSLAEVTADVHSPVVDESVPAELLDALMQVDKEAHGWARELLVSMGQAQKLTELKDSQIRYFEELDALHPQKTSRQAGASRLYTVADLRRLRILSLLTRQGYRAAEATELLKRHLRLVDQGTNPSVASVIEREQRAVADGFLLARLVSQLLGAIEAELAEPEHEAGTLRVRGAVFPLRAVFASEQPAHDEIEEQVNCLLRNPTGFLLARVTTSDTTVDAHLPPTLLHSEQDTQTVLFFSEEARDLGWAPHYQYCVYIPPGQPQRTVIVLVETEHEVPLQLELEPADTVQEPADTPQERGRAARKKLLNLHLELAERIWTTFCNYSLAKNYRYRSDGFPLTQSRHTYKHLLKLIRAVIFPDDDTAMAVLLVPDSLDHPNALVILAHDGYARELELRARLDLRSNNPQGLSGRAYRLREPFLTLQAQDDPYIEYALAEGCTQALAVPLATSWGIAPFGVLYLATRSPNGALRSESVYAAMVLGTALSEMLGRWWLTRLRRDLDMTLHREIEHLVRWIDSLDTQGPDFDRGMQAITHLWEEIETKKYEPAFLHRKMVLVVLDIDQYRETVQMRSNELLPIAAQRHVRDAIATIEPNLESYWFNNDHALLILRSDLIQNPRTLIERIQDQVSLTSIGAVRRDGSAAYISISAAYKMLSFQALHDLGKRGPGYLREQVSMIVEHLCQETQRAEAASIISLDRGATQAWVAESRLWPGL